jgi:hypothetical protein
MPCDPLRVAVDPYAEILAQLATLRTGQAALHHEVRALRELLERRAPDTRDDDRHGRLLTQLARAMGGCDLEFTAPEVTDHAGVDHDLAEILRACGVRRTSEVGALFRTLRDRTIGGLRLVRDGRAWRLERST